MDRRDSEVDEGADWSDGADEVLPIAPLRSLAVRLLAPRCSETWVQAAAKLPGKVLQMQMVVLGLLRLGKSIEVNVSPSMPAPFGAARQASYRGVEALQAAGRGRAGCGCLGFGRWQECAGRGWW